MARTFPTVKTPAASGNTQMLAVNMMLVSFGALLVYAGWKGGSLTDILTQGPLTQGPDSNPANKTAVYQGLDTSPTALTDSTDKYQGLDTNSALLGTPGSSVAKKGSYPKGVGIFDGRPVARWIIPELQYARKHGWKGHITSGWRPATQVITGPVVAPQGKSQHQGTSYPNGAVDFGGAYDAKAAANRAAFVKAAAGYSGPKLRMPQGFRDDGHMSGTGH